MTNPHTLTYRGYEIDPIHDPDENGDWTTCHPLKATCFRVYPESIDRWALDVEMLTLEAAIRAIDADADGEAAQ